MLEEFKIESRIESDHMLLVSVWMSKESRKEGRNKEKKSLVERTI